MARLLSVDPAPCCCGAIPCEDLPDVDFGPVFDLGECLPGCGVSSVNISITGLIVEISGVPCAVDVSMPASVGFACIFNTAQFTICGGVQVFMSLVGTQSFGTNVPARWSVRLRWVSNDFTLVWVRSFQPCGHFGLYSFAGKMAPPLGGPCAIDQLVSPGQAIVS